LNAKRELVLILAKTFEEHADGRSRCRIYLFIALLRWGGTSAHYEADHNAVRALYANPSLGMFTSHEFEHLGKRVVPESDDHRSLPGIINYVIFTKIWFHQERPDFAS
jgi:hypothetical protein